MRAGSVRRVGILTGGGDVPGLNTAIKSFVCRMRDAGWEVLGLRRGWAALLSVRPYFGEDNSDWVRPLTRENTRTIDRSGGTMLHTSRLNPSILRPDAVPEHLRGQEKPSSWENAVDLTAATIRAIEFLGLDALVAIGGDGTLSFARHLHLQGVPMIAIPKTMDNDVWGTDYCIGFSTAVTRSVQYISDLRTVAGSHERFLIVELFGRYSGETCLLSAIVAGADRALIAEVPFDPARVAELLARDKAENPSHYAVVTVSEGAYPAGGQPFESGKADAVGHRELGGVGRYVREILQRDTGSGVIYQRLGYLMRSGAPDPLDQLVAGNFGGMAASLVQAGRTGQLTAIQDGKYTSVPITTIGEQRRQVDTERFYDREQYRPKVIDPTGLPMFLN